MLTTFSLACISRSFRLANTCMCDDTCFLVRVFPVRSFMYLAINSFRPAKNLHLIISFAMSDGWNSGMEKHNIMDIGNWHNPRNISHSEREQARSVQCNAAKLPMPIRYETIFKIFWIAIFNHWNCSRYGMQGGLAKGLRAFIVFGNG